MELGSRYFIMANYCQKAVQAFKAENRQALSYSNGGNIGQTNQGLNDFG
jgi:hypothetical protein